MLLIWPSLLSLLFLWEQASLQVGDSIIISTDAQLIDIEGNSVNWSSLFSRRDRLIFFYYSKQFCDFCFDREMERLSRLPARFAEDIVVLLSVNNNNELTLYKNRFNVNFRFFNVGNTIFSEKVNRLFRPYFFVADRNFNTSLLFLPDKNIEQPTVAYLTEVLSN